MTRNVLVASAFGAAIALGFVNQGCSSTSNGGGTGGATTGTGGATAGTGGATAGTGGRTGGTGGVVAGTGGAPAGTGGRTDAGSGDTGSDAPATLPACASNVDNGVSCNSNPACAKTCGPNTMSLSLTLPYKTCTCSGANGTWSCPSTNGSCKYPTDADLTCLRLPATGTPPACPRDVPDGSADAGLGLIRPGVTTCMPPNSEVCGNLCGSATAGTFSYQDQGAGKVGYCACVNGAFQCAAVSDWYYP
jgi:hypothetical protein